MARYLVKVDDREFDIKIERRAAKYAVTVNGSRVDVVRHRLGESRSLLLIDDKSHEVDVRANGYDQRRMVFMMGMEIPVAIEDYNLAQMRKTAGMSSQAAMSQRLTAAMPGLVVQVKVQPGDKVNAGQPLLVLEAMKMENIIKAPAAATVKAVHVHDGKSVEKDDLLVEFE